MDVRVGLIFLVVLGASWACHARQLVRVDVEVFEVTGLEEMEAVSKVFFRNDNVCTMCEQYAAKALGYLSDNNTQGAVIDVLHQTCDRVPSFKQKCVTLVDYYTPLFFLEVSSLQPVELCQKANLCEEFGRPSSLVHEDSCGICHKTVSDVLIKLQDPDNQLEILEMLLKACNSMEKYVKKCKRMVFEYGPIILTNAEKYLENNDICTMLHACNSTLSITKEWSQEVHVPLLADS
jgi:saposin